jgi:bacterioferritin
MKSKKSDSNTFVSDIAAIRDRARRHMDQGAVTERYGADRDTVLRILSEALATEVVCVLRYRRHYYMASGIHAQSVGGVSATCRRGAGACRSDRQADRAAWW